MLFLTKVVFSSWQDIVVGAPQYFEKEGEIGGAVYVYINQAGQWDTVTPIRINGPQDSMFGLAVENLGDINQDGYHGEPAVSLLMHMCTTVSWSSWKSLLSSLGSDFAVGAPYDDDGAGSVYIYHGSEAGLSSMKAAQVCVKVAKGLT